MLPEARLVHRTVQRFRVKIPSARGDAPFFAHLQEELSKSPLVTATRVNPATASVLILHSAELAAVAAYARERGLFRLQEKGVADLARTTVATYRKVNQKVKRLSGGELDLAQGVFGVLIVTGLYQLARGKLSAPPWHTAFWYALSIFLKAQEK